MGDRGQKRNAKKHIVQSGESYESIAGLYKGDQRAFGDFMRANGYKALKPGMEINIPQERRKSYFVSNRDVNASNQAGANSSLPAMQSYGDYQSNYKAAVAAGGTGVRGSAFQGASLSGGATSLPGTGKTAGGAPAGINWGSGGAAISAPGIPKAPSLTGRDAASAWMAQDATQKTQAAIAKGNALESGMVGTAKPGTPTQVGFVQSLTQGAGVTPGEQRTQTSEAAQLSGNKQTAFSAQYPNSGPVNANSRVNLPGGVSRNVITQGNTPAALPPTPTTPAVQGNLPPSVQAQSDKQFAEWAVTAIANNKGVPQFLSKGQSRNMYQMMLDDQNLAKQIYTLYDLVNGEYQAKGSLLAPNLSIMNDNNIPDGYNYSNTPPQGYNSDSNVISTGGRRRAPSQPWVPFQPRTPAQQTGWNTQEYTLRIGQ